MHMHAGRRRCRAACSPARRGQGPRANGTPNLFSALPVAILWWVLASTSGLTRKAMRAVAPRAAATSLSALSSGSDSTLKAKMPASSAKAISRARLADAREHDPLRRHLDRQRAAKLALRHHVHAGAEPAERGQHAEIGVRLDRIADQRIGRGRRRHRRTPDSDARASPTNSNRRGFQRSRRGRQDRPPRRGAHSGGRRRAGRRNGALQGRSIRSSRSIQSRRSGACDIFVDGSALVSRVSGLAVGPMSHGVHKP